MEKCNKKYLLQGCCIPLQCTCNVCLHVGFEGLTLQQDTVTCLFETCIHKQKGTSFNINWSQLQISMFQDISDLIKS
jgi:hypothetical protein